MQAGNHMESDQRPWRELGQTREQPHVWTERRTGALGDPHVWNLDRAAGSSGLGAHEALPEPEWGEKMQEGRHDRPGQKPHQGGRAYTHARLVNNMARPVGEMLASPTSQCSFLRAPWQTGSLPSPEPETLTTQLQSRNPWGAGCQHPHERPRVRHRQPGDGN